jgi:hypothetical protein
LVCPVTPDQVPTAAPELAWDRNTDWSGAPVLEILLKVTWGLEVVPIAELLSSTIVVVSIPDMSRTEI